MEKNGTIQAPKNELPLIMKLMIAGVVLGIGLIALELFLENHIEVSGGHPHWALKILGHVGTGMFVATLAGIGIDRLFHHEHLSALVGEINARFEQSEERAAQLIPATLAKLAGGKTLLHIQDKQEIYRVICAKLELYPCFSNTIINLTVGEPSQFRLEYYRRKIDLVNTGKLTCRELVSSNAGDIIKGQLNRVTQTKRKNFIVGMVEVNPSMGSFVNFCIFQRDFRDCNDAFLMLGWFSDPQLRYQHHRHTCIATDHPELIRMFSEYFEIMEKSSTPHAG